MKDLENLGLQVREVNDVYICRTQKGNLIVIDYSYDEMFEGSYWHVEFYNTNATHLFDNFEDVLEVVKNYLGGK